MSISLCRLAAVIIVAAGAVVQLGLMAPPVEAQSKTAKAQQIARGKYLVGVAGCTDCHTPGYFLGKPDAGRYLGGSEVGFEIPGLGVFHGPNLTPDKETGLGNWTDKQILDAMQKGVRPDGRMLAPTMPAPAYAKLTAQDAQAIVAYLRSIPEVKNKVPGPFGTTEKPASFVMKVVPPQQGVRPCGHELIRTKKPSDLSTGRS